MTTTSAPRRSSPTPQPVGIAETTSQGPNGGYAFFIHSQETMTNRLSPDAVGKPAARQKRRRTSPEDHAILEAEYQRDPKPDKSARMGIVARVALGEKEVQIWFQNRRQMTRRKSRPLEAHEILSNLYPCQSTPSGTSPLSSRTANNSSQEMHWSQVSNDQSQSSQEVTSKTHDDTTNARGPMQTELGNDVDSVAYSALQNDEDVARIPTGPVPRACVNAPTTDTPVKRHDKASVAGGEDGHVRAEGQSFSSPVDVTSVSQTSLSSSASLGSSQNSDSVRSAIRLSLSLDGKAEVVTNSPSPPRPQPVLDIAVPRRPGPLERSQSAVSSASQKSQPLDDFTLPWPRRGTSGRSRDARTWEFYCDSDARNALSVQAEAEQKGSAIGAIGLIRSLSNKAAESHFKKRSAQMNKEECMKRKRLVERNGQRSKLSRATSSVARLQTDQGNTMPNVKNPKEKEYKPNSQTAIYQDHSGDSDKENWVPGTQSSNLNRPRASANPQISRSVLGENNLIPSHAVGLGAVQHEGSGKFKSRTADSGRTSNCSSSQNCEGDDEVAAFMGETMLPGGDEDLDCIQGLLSLSQGVWR